MQRAEQQSGHDRAGGSRGRTLRLTKDDGLQNPLLRSAPDAEAAERGQHVSTMVQRAERGAGRQKDRPKRYREQRRRPEPGKKRRGASPHSFVRSALNTPIAATTATGTPTKLWPSRGSRSHVYQSTTVRIATVSVTMKRISLPAALTQIAEAN